MEVKINKEIRNYTESMFFWTVPQTVHFFCPCLQRGGGVVFLAPTTVRNGNPQLGLYLRCVPLCGYGIYQIQRYDRRAVCLGVD